MPPIFEFASCDIDRVMFAFLGLLTIHDTDITRDVRESHTLETCMAATSALRCVSCDTPAPSLLVKLGRSEYALNTCVGANIVVNDQ